jgi:glycosyltransferase involved in cell wall biosynthesis
MTVALSILLIVLAVSLLGQASVIFKLSRVLRESKPVEVPDEDLPKFCVGMTLRGADPHLPETLRRVMRQDYPNYEFHVVIDSQADPAWAIVEEAIAECDVQNVFIHELRDRYDTCSRYCSALAQYIDQLDDSTELIGFCAGDSLVPKHWLREMAAAFSDPEVGGTLGNRWYIPTSNQWGTIIRRSWNASAVPSMWVLGSPWSSALSMRYSDAKKMNLSEKLKHSLVEDAPSRDAIQDLGLKMKFLPQLMVPNYEDISVSSCFQFIYRQTLFTRLYNRSWATMFIGSIVRAFLVVFPWFYGAYFLIQGQANLGYLTLGAAFIYQAGLITLLSVLDNAIQSVLPEKRDINSGSAIIRLLKVFCSAPINQVMQVAAFFCCLSVRKMEWRGVTYDVNGPWDIHVVSDEPITTSNLESNQSL